MKLFLVVVALAAAVAFQRWAARGSEALPYYDSAEFTPKWTRVSHHIGDFRLTTQTGGRVTQADLAGHIHVASFIFTTCPSLCPTLVQQLKRVQDATADVSGLLLVSYSVTARLVMGVSFARAEFLGSERWDERRATKRGTPAR